jgi:hypothetical protein
VVNAVRKADDQGCWWDPMLQLLVGTVVSVCNVAIHALVMATVVQISSRIVGAKDTAQHSVRLTTLVIATVSIATVPALMAAHFAGRNRPSHQSATARMDQLLPLPHCSYTTARLRKETSDVRVTALQVATEPSHYLNFPLSFAFLTFTSTPAT